MTGRPLHAVVLSRAAASGRVLDLLPAALDGTGPAILPLEASLPRARLRELVAAFAPSTVETVDGATSTGSRVDAPDRPVPVADGTAVVLATSGSTGPPKGVELSAAALLHSARASLARVGARRGDRWLLCLPVSHVAGIGVLVRSLVSDATPVVCERMDAAALEGAGCRFVSVVPTQLRRLLDAWGPWDRADGGGAGGAASTSSRPSPWSGYAAVLVGGAAAPAGLLEAARMAGVPVVTTYGMTETCGGCVYDGTPLEGVAVRTGSDGRIRVRGPVLFSGYRLRPDLTAAVFDDGWFVTADLGELEADGRVRVRGRVDDVINTGGEKVVAAEVAAALETCPGIAEVVVVGRPDPEWGERVTAVVVPVDPAEPPTLAGVRAHVAARLPRHAAPRELVVVDALPMLPSGKPDLEALRREQFPPGSVTR